MSINSIGMKKPLRASTLTAIELELEKTECEMKALVRKHDILTKEIARRKSGGAVRVTEGDRRRRAARHLRWQTRRDTEQVTP